MQSNNCERIREEKVSTKRGHESSCDSLNKRAGRITGRDYCSNRTPDDKDCLKGSSRERRGYRMEGQRRGDLGSPFSNRALRMRCSHVLAHTSYFLSNKTEVMT
mmetsp:Transcript_600/g.934  ORF Transcript_600/g.934 Transcript_600/m.934 type:complete len:104 (-) Transcript_600:1227-1538(-)